MAAERPSAAAPVRVRVRSRGQRVLWELTDGVPRDKPSRRSTQAPSLTRRAKLMRLSQS